MVRQKQYVDGTTMITKNGNWWTTTLKTSGRSGDYLRDNTFPCERPINIAVEHCSKTTNAIDVGTWIGDSTVHMAGLFDNVIGFEPHPLTHTCCLKNLAERNITNAEVYNIALSNVNELKTLYQGKTPFQGWVSDKKELPKDIYVHDQTEVQCLYLDSYHFEDIDFIKIDCDSHEGYVLQGAEQFFKNNSPVVLLEAKVRIHKDRQPDDMPDPFELLRSYGYVLHSRVDKADFLYVRRENAKQ